MSNFVSTGSRMRRISSGKSASTMARKPRRLWLSKFAAVIGFPDRERGGILRTFRAARHLARAQATGTACMTDRLGYRLKLGIVIPSTNSIVQPETDAMRPPGVTNHISRIHIGDLPLTNDIEFERMVE